MIVRSDGANIEIAEVGNFYILLFKQFTNKLVYNDLRSEKATSVIYNSRQLID